MKISITISFVILLFMFSCQLSPGKTHSLLSKLLDQPSSSCDSNCLRKRASFKRLSAKISPLSKEISQFKATKTNGNALENNSKQISKRKGISNRSISVAVSRFRTSQMQLLRDIGRTLKFRIRMDRIRRHQQVLARRLKRLEAQKQLMKTAKSSKARLDAMQRRIERLIERQQILHNRSRTLAERRWHQQKDSFKLYNSITSDTKKWYKYNFNKLQKTLAAHQSQLKGTQTGDNTETASQPKSRSDVKRIFGQFHQLIIRYGQLCDQMLVAISKVHEIDDQLSELIKKRSQLQSSGSQAEIAGLNSTEQQLNARRKKALKRKEKLESAIHNVAVNYSQLLMKYKLTAYYKMLKASQTPAKPKTTMKSQSKNESFKERAEKRLKQFQSWWQSEVKQAKLLKARRLHVTNRRARLQKRLVRLRTRRKTLDREIRKLEIQQWKSSRTKVGKGKKRHQASSSDSKHHGRSGVAVIRYRRHRLTQRIRDISAELQRLAQRATAVRCRIQRHEEAMMRLKTRRRGFLRRVKRLGLLQKSSTGRT